MSENEHKQYACCDNLDCPYCGGSGVVSGPDVDAFYEALEEVCRRREAEQNR